MKISKIVLAAVLAASVVNTYQTIDVQAAEDYIGLEDLSDNNTSEPAPWGVLPTPEQYRYQKEELAAFVHFGPNTFNEIEWGENYGDKTPDEIFKLEEDFDAETLVNSIKEAGFKKLIVTAKHHDGFCIWDTQYSDYNVAHTSYKDGKGDILAEISAACTDADIDMGLYLSPWDIHAPEYGYKDANGNPTTPENDVLDYNDYYVNQLNEILGNDKYGNNGHFTEIWMDGAKGSGSNAQEYDFFRWYETIQNKEGLPAGFDSECMIFQCGANTTVRWIGNENGYAAKNTWSKSNVDLEKNTCDDNVKGAYSYGYENGNKWTVPEADARITSGWFWGNKKKTPKSLTDLGNMYFNSVGNNATLLLNIPPNNKGKVDQEILDRVAEFGANINETFDDNLAINAEVKATSVRGNDIAYAPSQVIDGNDATYWTTDDGTTGGSLIIDLGKTTVFDVVSIEEAIQFGQSINEYKVEYRNGSDDAWKVMDEGETIGAKRLVRTAPVRATQIRITVDTNKEDALPIISEVGVYEASEGFALAGAAPAGMDVIDITDEDVSDGAGFSFTDGWKLEEIITCINGTNTWANAGEELEIKFHGSKIYLLGTKDPNHGKATIRIDGKEPVVVDTTAASRATGQMLFVSEDLEDGDHTLTLHVDTKAFGIEAAYVINNDGVGMIGLEESAYTMNEDERMNVKIVRVGGTTGEIHAKLQPNPGSAIQDDFNTELIPDIVFADGEKEVSVPVETRRNTNVTGDRQFSVEITDESNHVIIGFNDKAMITIRDTETSSMEGLKELLDEVSDYRKDWFISGWDDFTVAYEEALEVVEGQHSVESIEAVIEKLRLAKDRLVKRESYSENDRFLFPWKTNSSAVLEGEFGIIEDDSSNDNGWPMTVVDGAWASNGKYIDAIHENDKLKFPYTAQKAGTYRVTLTYQSGSKTNAVVWSEENGKIEAGECSAGATNATEVHTAEFDIEVKEAGDGVLVFTGPAGKSPRIDKFDIKPLDIELNQYTITATTNEGGVISDAGETTLTEGDNKTYTITANEGYKIKDVLVNGKSIGAVDHYTFENVIGDATISVVFEFAYYTEKTPFVFPNGENVKVLEGEFGIIENDESNDDGWPMTVVDGAWASNGKYIDAINENDKLKFPYTAQKAGTYRVVLTYQSGSKTNAVVWSEENGKIEAGECSAGATNATEVHTAEFDIEVKEAGDGVLVFTGPAGKSPRIDKFDITYHEVVHQHNAVKVEAKEETCTEDGNIEYWYCEDCDTYFSDEALTTPITLEETVIKATGHEETELVNVKKATCEEDGYSGDEVCEKCNSVVKEGKVIPKTGHNYENGSCTECGAKDPDYTEPADKEALSEAIDEANALDLDLYTKESVEALLEALKYAGEVNADKEATQEEVNDALAKLTAALEDLQPAEPTDPEEPENPIEPEDGDKEEGPDSGDSTNVGGLLTLLGLAGVAIAYETRKRMR